MSRQSLSAAALCSVLLSLGFGAAVAAGPGTETAAIHIAELTPRGIGPANAIRPSSTLAAKDLGEVNRRLIAMQREINQLKAGLNRLRTKPAPPAPAGQSSHSADEAYTVAAEARDIALRAEQKADQALSTAAQALGAAQSH